MKITEMIQRTLILGPEIQTLEQASRVMLNCLAERHIPEELVPQFLKSVLRREELGSTAIGCGLAVPHAANLPVKQRYSIIAVAPHGIDGKSLDAEPVYIVLLLLAPPNPIGTFEHFPNYRETEMLWRFLRNEEYQARLRLAQTAEELEFILNEYDDSESTTRKWS